MILVGNPESNDYKISSKEASNLSDYASQTAPMSAHAFE